MGGYTATAKTVEWGTPDYVFDPLNKEFGFTVDVCAADGMQVVDRYFSPSMDGLKQNWDEEVAFMNPPYGKDLPKWIEKASHSMGKVVALIPAKTDTRYFELCMNVAAEIRFIKGRVAFRGTDTPAPFGVMIVIFDRIKRERGVKNNSCFF